MLTFSLGLVKTSREWKLSILVTFDLDVKPKKKKIKFLNILKITLNILTDIKMGKRK